MHIQAILGVHSLLQPVSTSWVEEHPQKRHQHIHRVSSPPIKAKKMLLEKSISKTILITKITLKINANRSVHNFIFAFRLGLNHCWEPLQHKFLAQLNLYASSSPGPSWHSSNFYLAHSLALLMRLRLSRTKTELTLALNLNLLFAYQKPTHLDAGISYMIETRMSTKSADAIMRQTIPHMPL